ncbi:hypothetical protein BD413DRAFT_191606 [Trametes elegans]|nr:hypothetical protein BD413DRAFT_191606 [Trametes elegans]
MRCDPIPSSPARPRSRDKTLDECSGGLLPCASTHLPVLARCRPPGAPGERLPDRRARLGAITTLPCAVRDSARPLAGLEAGADKTRSSRPPPPSDGPQPSVLAGVACSHGRICFRIARLMPAMFVRHNHCCMHTIQTQSRNRPSHLVFLIVSVPAGSSARTQYSPSRLQVH